jgi:hypothetical protein
MWKCLTRSRIAGHILPSGQVVAGAYLWAAHSGEVWRSAPAALRWEAHGGPAGQCHVDERVRGISGAPVTCYGA